MQIMLGNVPGWAASAETAIAERDGTMGNVWLALANYVGAPAKGGTQVIRKQSGGIEPKHLAVGALAAAAAYLALG